MGGLSQMVVAPSRATAGRRQRGGSRREVGGRLAVSGRTTDSFGTPLARTRVTIQNTSNGDTQTVSTNSFGNYRFDDLPAGDFYVISVWSKKYVFDQPTQSFVLNDAIENVDFTATP